MIDSKGSWERIIELAIEDMERLNLTLDDLIEELKKIREEEEQETGLTKEKKEILKNHMGSASGKIDRNRVLEMDREERREFVRKQTHKICDRNEEALRKMND